jgi:hypothetical protein
MSVRLPSRATQSTSPSLPVKQDFPRIIAFFDALELICKRLERLVWKAKVLLFGTGFLLFLIYELALFAKHLLATWSLTS